MSNTPNPVYEKLMKCYESFRSQIDFQPEVALILGSGLGDFANDIRVTATRDYHDIEGFPVSTVPGHAGRFIFGYVGDVPVVCMQGRVHYYEGYPMTDVVLPTRLMKLMGAKALFLTNAAGGIKQGTKPGSLMLLNGQIACFVPSPLIGPNIDELGTRFPDMSQIYDAVGMSTACEAIAARHMGMRVIGISCITNLAAGISPQPLCHAEVQEAADMVAPQFKKLVAATIQGIAKTL